MLDCDSLYFIYTVAIASLIPVVIIPWYFVRKETKMMEARRKKRELETQGKDSTNIWKGLYW